MRGDRVVRAMNLLEHVFYVGAGFCFGTAFIVIFVLFFYWLSMRRFGP
jgi:hypothetical protein